MAMKADAGVAGWAGQAVEVRLIYLLRCAYFALFCKVDSRQDSLGARPTVAV